MKCNSYTSVGWDRYYLLVFAMVSASQPTCTCSKSTMETPEQCVKYAQS